MQSHDCTTTPKTGSQTKTHNNTCTTTSGPLCFNTHTVSKAVWQRMRVCSLGCHNLSKDQKRRGKEANAVREAGGQERRSSSPPSLSPCSPSGETARHPGKLQIAECIDLPRNEVCACLRVFLSEGLCTAIKRTAGPTSA